MADRRHGLHTPYVSSDVFDEPFCALSRGSCVAPMTDHTLSGKFWCVVPPGLLLQVFVTRARLRGLGGRRPGVRWGSRIYGLPGTPTVYLRSGTVTFTPRVRISEHEVTALMVVRQAVYIG